MHDLSVWFWQRTLTPHMGALAATLAESNIRVTFVSNVLLSEDRMQQGWETPQLGKVKFLLAADKDAVIRLAAEAPLGSIHLCQGLRGNGLVADAQHVLRKRGVQQWAIMETVDDEGWRGVVKRILYRWLLIRWRGHLAGILAIGRETPAWIVARGMPSSRIYPFAYFLIEPQVDQLTLSSVEMDVNRDFRFIFVGQLIERKRVDQLIAAITTLKRFDIELWVVGSGPEEARLRTLADALMPGQVRWLGRQPMSAVSNLIYQADCLVLPSRHDGWGAVVSEALMVGTPVICSDACGSSVVVQASSVGSIFPANNRQALTKALHKQYETGLWRPERRQQLAEWAKCLGAKAGADYLAQILRLEGKSFDSIVAPWKI